MARKAAPRRGKAPAAGAVRKPARKSEPGRRTPALEWAAAVLGAALTSLVLAVIGHQALLADRRPPALSVEALEVVRAPDGFVLRVQVRNLGGRPAAQVVVEGTLAGPGEPETSEATFDYIAAHGQREGGLAFKSDPRRASLTLRAKGYVDP